MITLNGVLLGTYICISIFVFLITSLFTVLGGKSDDLWKPFWYTIIWPYFVVKFVYLLIVGG